LRAPGEDRAYRKTAGEAATARITAQHLVDFCADMNNGYNRMSKEDARLIIHFYDKDAATVGADRKAEPELSEVEFTDIFTPFEDDPNLDKDWFSILNSDRTMGWTTMLYRYVDIDESLDNHEVEKAAYDILNGSLAYIKTIIQLSHGLYDANPKEQYWWETLGMKDTGATDYLKDTALQ